MKKIIILVLLVIIMSACDTKEKYTYKSVNSIEAKEIMKEKTYQIIDVRTKEEYDEGHIKNAINIEYTKIDTVNIEQSTILFVYCKSGRRSKIAAQELLEMGYQVYDLGNYDSITLDKE